MEDSPVIGKIIPIWVSALRKMPKQIYYSHKNWNTDSIVSILPIHIMNKIKAILVPISDLKDRIKMEIDVAW